MKIIILSSCNEKKIAMTWTKRVHFSLMSEFPPPGFDNSILENSKYLVTL